jgi:hypothetical protein
MTEGIFQSGLKTFKIKKRWGMENDNTKVSVTLGYTLNLGNFQSLRIDLGVVDSKRDGENSDQAFDRVYKFVEDKLTEKIQEAQLEADSKD